jgi:redox-sensitive bicupin YhaK (pirin superfamily)
MIQHIPASQRHFSDFGWLKTYWLFSFDSYHDPQNIHWGALRVFNDDRIDGGQGFPMHPHREMEIVTIVHSGELTHEDSADHKGVIRPGDVQRMTAGTGIQHSEFNYGKDPVDLFQIWILPREGSLKPGYAQKNYGSIEPNVLKPLVSGHPLPGALDMHADASIYMAHLEPGKKITYEANPARRIFMYVVEGSLHVNTVQLERRDQARIKEEAVLNIEANSDARFVLIDAAAQA